MKRFISYNRKTLINVSVFSLFTCLSVTLFPLLSIGQGDLLIMPKRVVFEGNKRAENLNLANVGKDTATYVISLVNVIMGEDGSIKRVTEEQPGQVFADKNLRIFPRTVTLAPKEAQVVKIQVINGSQLPAGEYRSNIYFRAIPNAKPLGDSTPKSDSTVSVRITPTYGISLPAIIRIGENTAAATMSDAMFDVESDTIPVVKFTLNRTGNMSTYGDLSVDHISPYGKITRVAIVNGIAVYTPNPKRLVKMKLNRNAGADLSSGKLNITYSDQSPKSKVLAEAEIDLK